MKCGDIIFVYGETPIISPLIRLFDRGKFSHVCICVSEDNYILEADIFIKSQIVPMRYKKYEIVRLNLTQEQIKKIPDIASKLEGIQYDYLLVFWYFLKSIFNLKKPWKSPRREICSELVDLVLYDIGAISEEEYLSAESPNMMYERMKLLSK